METWMEREERIGPWIERGKDWDMDREREKMETWIEREERWKHGYWIRKERKGLGHG